METALLQAHQLLGGVAQQGSPGQANRRETPNGRRTPGVDRPAVPRLLVVSHFITWSSQPEAAAKLHVSERTLIRWRSSKFLKPGKHWRRALPSPRARVLYNIEQCEKYVAKACSRDGSMLEQNIKLASQLICARLSAA